MLLRIKTSITLLILISASSVLGIPVAGNYDLVKGPKELCESFELTPGLKFIRISERYVFPMRNSTSVVQSDIDPQCSFVEKVQKRENESSLFLARTNEELCQNKVQTTTSSSVRFEKDQITLWQVLDADVSFSCQWKKR